MLAIEQLYITITERCNMRCPHCWVTAGERVLTYPEITVSEMTQVIDHLLPIGLKRLKITGGEPFVRKQDTFAVIEYGVQKGLGISIETNASLLDNKDYSYLESLPPMEFGVSLDFPDKRFDVFRRMEGAFELVTSAIKALSKKHRVAAAMVVTKDNLHLLEQTAEVIIAHGGIPRFLVCMPHGRAMDNEGDMLLSVDEMLKSFAEMERLRIKFSGNVSMSVPYAFLGVEGFQSSGRCAADKTIGLLPDGSVSLCGIGIGNRDMVYGNIREDDITNIINNSEALKEIRRLVAREQDYEGVCGKCMFSSVCAPRCPAHSKSILGGYGCSFPICHEIYHAGMFPPDFIVKE